MLEMNSGERNGTLKRFKELLSYGPLRAFKENDVFSVFDAIRNTGDIIIAQESPDSWFIDLFRSDELIRFHTQCMEIICANSDYYLNSPNNMLINVFLELNLTLWNTTDKSQGVASRLLTGTVVPLMHRLLKLPQLNANNCRKQKKIRLIVQSTVGILHNGIRHFWMNRAVYRKEGLVAILNGLIYNQPVENLAHYLNNRKTDENIQMLSLHTACLFLLAFVADENESLSVTDDHIVYILYALEDALNQTGTFHSQSFGYDANELLQGLCRLAGSEKNAAIFLKNDTIKLIERTLQAAIMQKSNPSAKESGCSPDKLASAALSFLLNLCHARRNNFSLEFRRLVNEFRQPIWSQLCQRTSESILYTLDQEADRATEHYGSTSELMAKDRKSDLPTGHVMISYQHSTKAVVEAVKIELECHGFRVWVDTNYPCGSFLNAMAEGIDDAAVVIAVVCQAFKLSPYCRQEMMYAFRRQKIIIPLLLETNFQPSGWLQFLWLQNDIIPLCDIAEVPSAVRQLTSKLDDLGISRSYSKPSKICGFNHELKDDHSSKIIISDHSNMNELSLSDPLEKQGHVELTTDDELLSPSQSHTQSSNKLAKIELIKKWFPPSLASWSNEHISLWLLFNNLGQYIEACSDLNGSLLVEMIRMYKICPDHLAKSLQSDMEMRLTDQLRFFESLNLLKKVFEHTESHD